MKKNIGSKERILRTVVGVALIVIAVYVPMSTFWTIVLFALAGIMLLSAAFAFCPLYTLLGYSSAENKLRQ